MNNQLLFTKSTIFLIVLSAIISICFILITGVYSISDIGAFSHFSLIIHSIPMLIGFGGGKYSEVYFYLYYFFLWLILTSLFYLSIKFFTKYLVKK